MVGALALGGCKTIVSPESKLTKIPSPRLSQLLCAKKTGMCHQRNGDRMVTVEDFSKGKSITLRDSMSDGYVAGERNKNGYLTFSRGYIPVDKDKLVEFGKQAEEFTKNNYSDDKIHAQYSAVFNQLIK